MRTRPRDAARRRDDRLHRTRIVLVFLRHRPKCRRKWQPAGAGIRSESFDCFMPTIRCTGRSAQPRRCSASDHAGARIMAAVEPQLPIRAAAAPPAGRAGVAAAPAIPRRRSRRRSPHPDRQSGRTQGGDGDAGVVQLERARQRRRRQVERAAAHLRSESRAACGVTCQSRSRSRTGAPMRAASASSTAATSAGCAPIATGTPGFMIPAFSAAIAASVSPSNLAMIERDRRDRARRRTLDHVGGVAAAAEPDLQHAQIGRRLRRTDGTPPP